MVMKELGSQEMYIRTDSVCLALIWGPALCVGGDQEFKRSGNLRLSLELEQH